jgi:hypothetical protein
LSDLLSNAKRPTFFLVTVCTLATIIFRLCLDAACLPACNPDVLPVTEDGARAARDAILATAARRAAPPPLTVLAGFPVLACAPSTAGKRMLKTSDPKVEHTSTMAASNIGVGFILLLGGLRTTIKIQAPKRRRVRMQQIRAAPSETYYKWRHHPISSRS